MRRVFSYSNLLLCWFVVLWSGTPSAYSGATLLAAPHQQTGRRALLMDVKTSSNLQSTTVFGPGSSNEGRRGKQSQSSFNNDQSLVSDVKFDGTSGSASSTETSTQNFNSGDGEGTSSSSTVNENDYDTNDTNDSDASTDDSDFGPVGAPSTSSQDSDALDYDELEMEFAGPSAAILSSNSQQPQVPGIENLFDGLNPLNPLNLTLPAIDLPAIPANLPTSQCQVFATLPGYNAFVGQIPYFDSC